MVRLVVLGLLVAACSGQAAAPSSVATSTTAPPTTPSAPWGDLPAGTAVEEVELDGRALTVAVAATPAERTRGLRRVSDLGELDGMVFRWESDLVTSPFTMQDTVIPLDIAFFAADGSFVDGFRMEPCAADPCPTFAAAAPYAFALESPAGSLPPVGPGSRLEIGG